MLYFFRDIDDKYAKKLDRMGMGGPIVEFKEKKDYLPEIKLEYADEAGRLMNEKEAFRFLSWKYVYVHDIHMHAWHMLTICILFQA